MKKNLIYIADDEVNICNIIKSFLIKDGYDVEIFNNGRLLLDAFQVRAADMLVIDIMMPEMDGYSLCAAIRQISKVPIIMVSARDSEPDKIAGLTIGCDDYLTKPFSPLELIARIKSIFRRIEFDKSTDVLINSYTIKDLTLYLDTKHVEFSGENLNFTLMEFNLLLYLAQNKNKAISRDELLKKLWGFKVEAETRATDDMIKRIRKKLSDVGSTLRIQTVWGFGFKIEDKGWSI